ncbi:MAG: hypothetical protein GX896_01460 [Clostridiales bacterium]|nr:hypothetical protein [Clostridiales bacterium]
MRVIYLDVLIITNLIISLTLLSLTAKATYSSVKNHRLIIAGFFGSLSSILILFNKESLLISLAITIAKLVITYFEIAICFKTFKFKKVFKLILIYLLFNFIFIGILIVIWNLSKGKLVYVKNYSVYFNISIGWLIVISIATYLVISIFELIKNRSFSKEDSYKIKAIINGRSFESKAIADTGNKLVDMYYGKPVVVFYNKEISDYLKIGDEMAVVKNKLHILPYTTIKGQGIIYVTKPQEIEISGLKDKKTAEVCIGILSSENEYPRVIFNPKILV